MLLKRVKELSRAQSVAEMVFLFKGHSDNKDKQYVF